MFIFEVDVWNHGQIIQSILWRRRENSIGLDLHFCFHLRFFDTDLQSTVLKCPIFFCDFRYYYSQLFGLYSILMLLLAFPTSWPCIISCIANPTYLSHCSVADRLPSCILCNERLPSCSNHFLWLQPWHLYLQRGQSVSSYNDSNYHCVGAMVQEYATVTRALDFV